MNRELWILVAVCGVLALWVLGAVLGVPDAARIELASEALSVPSTKRISAAGVSYGDCDGIALAVLLYPEPCDWDRARRRTVASR
jgi:hypothetical protein